MHSDVPSTPQELLQADGKDQKACRGFSLVHLTTYSVYWLRQWDIPTTYENISVLNARLFPFDFSMTGFPELPDGLRTNRSLLQMRPKYRGFATSDPRLGVFLTERGEREALRVIARIGPPSFQGRSLPTNAIPTVDPRRGNQPERSRNPAQIMREIRTRILFRRFKENRLQDADAVHFLGLVGLYDHSLPSEVRRTFKELRADAAMAKDDEVLEFLELVAQQFAAYLNRPDPKREGVHASKR